MNTFNYTNTFVRNAKRFFIIVTGAVLVFFACKGTQPVDPLQKQLDDAKKEYALYSDSCLNYFVPKCLILEVDGDNYYAGIYNTYLGRDGQIGSAVTTGNNIEGSQAWTNGVIPDDHKPLIEGGRRTGQAALDADSTIVAITAQMSGSH